MGPFESPEVAPGHPPIGSPRPAPPDLPANLLAYPGVVLGALGRAQVVFTRPGPRGDLVAERHHVLMGGIISVVRWHDTQWPTGGSRPAMTARITRFNNFSLSTSLYRLKEERRGKCCGSALFLV